MDEYIEREAAIRVVNGQSSLTMTRSSLIDSISKLPDADVAPVAHGRWEQTEAPFMNECEDCSVCGYRTVWGHRFNYCPNCGARMDGGGR